MPQISISIVSHLQCSLVEQLLADIEKFCGASSIEVIVTLNTDEEMVSHTHRYPLKIISNSIPLGFGANHNQAFAQSTGEYFCVMNPDIRLNQDPFPALLSCLEDPAIGAAAPAVTGENGEMEDSARRFPTPLKILCKVFGGCKGSDYVIKEETVFPDWVGGMFMLFPRKVFETLGGFDRRYFLYYEDVDLCARLRLHGYRVAVCPKAKVVHQARRSSRRNLRFLKWHLASMVRFFLSSTFLKFCWRRMTGGLL